MIAILINCITLGSYQPCYDTRCESNRCQWLKTFDHAIFLFFFMEMLIKMVAMGVSNAPQAYLADHWNRLDCFIVIAGGLEYILDIGNVNLTSIRTVRVLRPLRAINRIPSMRILVTLLLDTLPMLGNVLLLCFFVFFIFGIIGVQLWSGLLRQHCFISLPGNMSKPSYVPAYYRLPNSDKEYLCSTSKDNGLHKCQDLAPLRSTDSTTLCQNSLPLDWRPPVLQNNNGSRNSGADKSPDRLIDGELVPFDLVPGDESSPFLVKQMSPLIAQSVFQPAKRKKRDLLISPDERQYSSHSGSQPIRGNQSLSLHKRRRNRRSQLNKINGSHHEWSPPASKSGEEDGGTILVKQKQAILESSIVETNSNSDQFDSMSRDELDKSSRKHYLRRKARKNACINWNKYYTECKAGDTNPFQDTISFDNVGMAWTAIFLVISLEGWSDIMYLLQDSHSFWVWTYFVLLIVVGSFFMINLCLVVIATQFSATKKREMERMRQERLKFSSSSTLTATSESTNCYTVIVKSIARCLRRAKISFINYLKRRKCHQLRQKRLREQQLHNQSHQVTGIHLRPDTDLSGCEPSSRPSSSRVEARAQSGSMMNAATRRSSWRMRSAKQADCADMTNQQSLVDGDNQAQSGERLITGAPNESVPPAEVSGTGNPASIAMGPPVRTKSARTLKLKHAECEGSCSHKNYYDTNSRDRQRRRAKGNPCRHYHDCDLEDIEIEFCPKFISKNDRLQKFLHQLNESIKHLVDHRYFQRLILLAILINAISMGIEYHNQPVQLTEAVEISNIVFACLFLIEMILKLIAHGLYNYVIDGFNCFDGCIVILSILELFESSSNSSGLSVLRTFRLLRILKLVRFMPALRRQLVIMLRTLDNVAVFFALLVLFIFIFSILGMNLFGCKFCETLPDGTERCDRKNFNSLLWSLVTVFQILTQEDWNVVLFNGMEKTSHWAALYFVLLMTFGNYVLFNLLVAILVEGFSQEDDFKVSSSSSYNGSNKQAGQTNNGHSRAELPCLIYQPGAAGSGSGSMRALTCPPHLMGQQSIKSPDCEPARVLAINKTLSSEITVDESKVSNSNSASNNIDRLILSSSAKQRGSHMEPLVESCSSSSLNNGHQNGEDNKSHFDETINSNDERRSGRRPIQVPELGSERDAIIRQKSWANLANASALVMARANYDTTTVSPMSPSGCNKLEANDDQDDIERANDMSARPANKTSSLVIGAGSAPATTTRPSSLHDDNDQPNSYGARKLTVPSSSCGRRHHQHHQGSQTGSCQVQQDGAPASGRPMQEHDPKSVPRAAQHYWNYEQSLVVAANNQQAPSVAGQLILMGHSQPASVPKQVDASTNLFAIKRPNKRLVYFYDISDDIDEEIEFLSKSLESKSYATSMMGQHDHYLDNIAKSQAAAARAKAAIKHQQKTQHRINIQRAEQADQHIRALALDSLSITRLSKPLTPLDRHRNPSLSDSPNQDSGTPKKRFSTGSHCGNVINDHQPNIEIKLRPHWCSVPSHLNRLSMTMMRMYQSSLTSNLIYGRQERAALEEGGQFDRACCRVDYRAFSRALQSFLTDDDDQLDTVIKFSTEQQPTSSTNVESDATKQTSTDGRRRKPGQDENSHLVAILEPFKLFPNIATSVIDPNMMMMMMGQQKQRNKGATMNSNQRDLLVSIENYALAIARYEDRLRLGRQTQNRDLTSSIININRTTQAIRRGSAVVLSKLKLFNQATNNDTSSRQQQQQQQQHQPQPQQQQQTTSPEIDHDLDLDPELRHQLGCRSVPRLSLTKAESLINSSLDTNTNNDFRMPMSRDISDEVAIHIHSSYESLSSQPIGGDLAGAGRMRQVSSSHHAPAKGCLLGGQQISDLKCSSSTTLPAFGRHSIAHLPARSSYANSSIGIDLSPAERDNSNGVLSADGGRQSTTLARPSSYTPNLTTKRSSPRASVIGGWFTSLNRGNTDATGPDNSRRSSRLNTDTNLDLIAGESVCGYSKRVSQTSSQLAEDCVKLLQPNWLRRRRRRSFSGPLEWLEKGEHKPPNDLMLSSGKQKQSNKRKLKRIKSQKSNSSDYHSLNNRRVYKLDARGFQTKLRGIFYVITNDPLASSCSTQPASHGNQALTSLCQQLHSDHYQQQMLMYKDGQEDLSYSHDNDSSFDIETSQSRSQSGRSTATASRSNNCQSRRTFLIYFHWSQWMIQRRHHSLFIFSPQSRIRRFCLAVTQRKEFDYFVLFFIAMNCVTLAMERPKIPPWSKEREFLTVANYYFTFMFTLEMALKVIAKGLYYGKDAYLSDSWNIMDGSLVGFSLFDLLLSIVADRSPRIFAILRVFRLLRSLRPLRVINRLMGLKLVVQTLLLSLRPIGNIVLICCTFFIIFGILGVQLFKGTFYYCNGPDPLEIMRTVRTREDCLIDPRNRWINRKYNFDNLGQALMALFVLSSKDGWVNIMYTGLDAVGVDMQPRENYNEWRLLYFISFLLLVAFFVLNMFVGVVVENFHRCRKEQEMEEKARRAEKRQRKLDKRRRKLREPPYYANYGKFRLLLHKWVTGGYFDLLIAAVIGFNVVFMSLEHYQMPDELIHLLKVSNYVFTVAFIFEAAIKSTALGMRRYLKDRWNQLDVMIVAMSIIGIIFEEMDSFTLPINPTLLRVLRVMRIARVLKLLKMAKGIRALLDTVMQALPQVGNLGLLFFLLFFIFAALGVELFGRLECNDEYPCSGLMDQHAHFQNFGLAFLTLFRVATGDNWNGIMKDTLRDKCDPSSNCLKNCCVSQIIAPLYFVVFVLLAQFVLVNVVVAVLMKHLEESHHEMEIDEEYELDKQLAEELEAKKRALLEARERQNLYWI